MNKHVNRLGREASDARKMIDDSESDSDESGNNLFHNISRCLYNTYLYYLESTGTPLIGRFLGPRKTRLNRNLSY